MGIEIFFGKPEIRLDSPINKPPDGQISGPNRSTRGAEIPDFRLAAQRRWHAALTASSLSSGPIAPRQAREAERQPGNIVWFNWYGNSRQLRFIEKWFPGERLTVGIVKMSFLQKLAYTSEVFTKE